MDDITVGVDIGTTSVKALAVDGEGTVVASARRPHQVRCGPRQLEHDADDSWRAGVTEAFAEVAAGRTVRGVSVAAMVPSLTAVDADGRPCGPGLLYGDARGRGTPGPTPAESGEAAGFLRWLAAESPEAAGFWPAQAVANHALCGRAAVDYATAYCLSPLFDGNGWSDEATTALGARPAQLPDVVADVREAVGAVGGDGGPPVGAGTVDALAAQLVAGADEPGDVLVLLGATLIVWLATPGWVERPGLWTVPHTAPGVGLIGGASNAGGLFVDWTTHLLAAGDERTQPTNRVDVPGSATGADAQVSADDAKASAAGQEWDAAGRSAPASPSGAAVLPLDAGKRTSAAVPGFSVGLGASAAGRSAVARSGSVAATAGPWVATGRSGSIGAVLDPGDVPVWLPYARGERTPLHNSGLRSGIVGLHLGHGPPALERAAYEAAGFVVRHLLELAAGPGVVPPRRIVAAGGGVRRAGWVQAVADCTGLPVDVAAVPDASALGTAFLARCVAELETTPADARRWVRTSHRLEPDPAWTAPCSERYRLFLSHTARMVEETR